ncbi:unnamed protein product [Choristocarpus tenellus]
MKVHTAYQVAATLLIGEFIRTAAVPCVPQTRSLRVQDTSEAWELSQALACSDGHFNVTWIHRVALNQTISVTEGSSLSITGTGDAVIDGNFSNSLFSVIGIGSRLRLENLSLLHGNSTIGGAVSAFNGSSVTAVDTSFQDNMAKFAAGAVYVGYQSNFIIDGNSTFVNNTAGESGG